MSQDSDEDVYDDVFLDMGNGLRWQLNFPYTEGFQGGMVVPRRMLHRQFKPGTTDLFTIDAGGIHIASLTHFVLESQATEFSKGILRPSKVTLLVNGIVVFRSNVVGDLTRNGRLTFPYPKVVK